MMATSARGSAGPAARLVSTLAATLLATGCVTATQRESRPSFATGLDDEATEVTLRALLEMRVR